MRKLLRRLLVLSVLAAVGYAIWRRLSPSGAADDTALEWQPQPVPFPPAPRPRPAASAPTVAPVPSGAGWIDATHGTCPASHPIKAKLSSGIFHVPGGTNYERTRPDRCYTDSVSAEADGLRPAKR